MPLTPLNKCFRSAITQRTLFFAVKWPKVPIWGPNQCFLGLNGQFVPPLPPFEVADKMYCMRLSPLNKSFSAAATKKHNFCSKMANVIISFASLINACYLTSPAVCLLNIRNE